MNAPTKIEASLHSAMAAAFAKIEGVTKGAVGQVGQQKYRYADLGAVIDAIKPALIENDLFFTQHPQPSECGVTVETMLHHASGESISMGALFVPANKKDAQGFGSALTYARRYALVTAFGVPTEDDDGNAAVKSQHNAITNEQFVRLQSLIQATSSNVQAFCQRLKVDRLDELPAAKFGEALELLENKLANMAKAESAAKAKENA